MVKEEREKKNKNKGSSEKTEELYEERVVSALLFYDGSKLLSATCLAYLPTKFRLGATLFCFGGAGGVKKKETFKQGSVDRGSPPELCICYIPSRYTFSAGLRIIGRRLPEYTAFKAFKVLNNSMLHASNLFVLSSSTNFL